MTILQLFRKIAAPAFCVALTTGLAACSGAEVEPNPGASGSANTAGNGTSGSNAASGTGNGTAGSNGAGSTGSPEVVGTFQVQVLADEAGPTTGMTKIVGQVSDGTIPPNVIWTTTKEDGG